jgi:amino acid transporter
MTTDSRSFSNHSGSHSGHRRNASRTADETIDEYTALIGGSTAIDNADAHLPTPLFPISVDVPLPPLNIDIPLSGGARTRSLNVAPLVAIMYFSVAGGPEGTETMIKNAGSFYTIIGVILCSLLWAAPTALMTAELSTRFPENGGFIIWARVAWGDFASGMAGWLQFCFTAADAALYPGLFMSYLSYSASWDASETSQWIVKSVFVAAITVLNLSGVGNVGHGSMLLMIFILGPFIIAVLIAFTGVFTGTTIVGTSFDVSNWLGAPDKPDFPAFVNVLLWNMGMWESASVCVGEVKNVPTAFPYALAVLVVIVVLNYLIPIMAFTALDADWSHYYNGYYIDVVRDTINPYFALVLGAGQCISSIGLFTSGIFKNAFMICGMGEQGMLPGRVAERLQTTNSPWIAILLTLFVTCPVMTLQSFGAILGVEMVFYCASLLLEISSLFLLRHRHRNDPIDPETMYHIPLRGMWLYLFYTPSILLCLYVILTASKSVLLISGSMIAAGVCLIIALDRCKKNRPDWFSGAEGVTQHISSDSSASATPVKGLYYGSDRLS